MTQEGPFFCYRCNKRLPINAIEGRVVVFCRHCKAENVLVSAQSPKFRQQIIAKA